MPYKQPYSVLVVVHTPDKQVLLIERADFANGWQSVTGSREDNEDWRTTAIRELAEETGLDLTQGELVDWEIENQYEIYPRWRARYAPGVTHNTERVFGFCVPAPLDVRLAEREHTASCWLSWQHAAEKVFSPSNAAAIRHLGGQAS